MSVTTSPQRTSRGKPEEPGQPPLQQKTSSQERKKHAGGGGGAANAEKANSVMAPKFTTPQLPPTDSAAGRQGSVPSGAAWGSKGPPSPARLRSMSERAGSLLPLERTRELPMPSQREISKSARTRKDSGGTQRWDKPSHSARMAAARSFSPHTQSQGLRRQGWARARQSVYTDLRRMARNESLWQPIQLEESDSDDEDATLQELRIRRRTRAGHLRRVSSSSNQWNMLKTYMDALKKRHTATVLVPEEEEEVTRFWRIKVSEENAKFFEAVRQNNVDNMNAALALGANPTARDEDGYTALHIAVEVDSLAALHALLLAGDIPVSASDTQGVTPLHLAVEMGKRLLVNALIMAGASINAVDRFGRNPLHYAIRGGKVRIVKLLLYCGADPNMPDAYGTTPLSMAVLTRPFPDIARSLLGAGALVDVESGAGVYLLSEAVLACFTETHLDAIRVLLESGAEVNRQEEVSGHTPLHLAVLSDNAPVAEVLLKCGADPLITNYSGETVLEMALLHGSRHVLTVLTVRTSVELSIGPQDQQPAVEPSPFAGVESIIDELFHSHEKQEEFEHVEVDEDTHSGGLQAGSSGLIHSVLMERTPVAGPLAGVKIPDIDEHFKESANKHELRHRPGLDVMEKRV